MDLSKNGITWVQCQICGKLYKIPQKLPVEALIVKAICPTCNGTKALNCGEDESDIYLYMNHTLDNRYYEY